MTLDEALSEAIKKDFRTACISSSEKAMLEYVEKITIKPAQITSLDIDSLRNAGFDDLAILQINLIASWFNYINRVADGLGVGRD